MKRLREKLKIDKSVKVGRGRKQSSMATSNLKVVQKAIERDPWTSNRRLAGKYNILRTSIQRIHNHLHIKPWKIHSCLELLDGDADRRFSQWLKKLHGNSSFYKLLVYSDEACFNLTGSINHHKIHYYSDANSHQVYPQPFKHLGSLSGQC